MYRSTVTNAGDEASIILLDDGRLMVVHRHNFQFQNGPACVAVGSKHVHVHELRAGRSMNTSYDPNTCAFKQVFSSDDGLTWSPPSVMKSRAGGSGAGVPPHSVMPELVALEGSGYALSGGRSGLYVWFCNDVACIDAGEWTTVNLALHHNNAVGKTDPAGPFSANCVNASLWYG